MPEQVLDLRENVRPRILPGFRNQEHVRSDGTPIILIFALSPLSTLAERMVTRLALLSISLLRRAMCEDQEEGKTSAGLVPVTSIRRKRARNLCGQFL
ncbi:hypothetical protein HQ520_17980 [bacterium]|nr:hypothetical protein [bacterium]